MEFRPMVQLNPLRFEAGGCIPVVCRVGRAACGHETGACVVAGLMAWGGLEPKAENSGKDRPAVRPRPEPCEVQLFLASAHEKAASVAHRHLSREIS